MPLSATFAPSDFVDVFIPLMAVMNAVPVIPVILNAVSEVPARRRASELRAAFITVAIVGLLLILAGGRLLSGMGLETDDLRVAGGVVLLVFSVHDLLFSRAQRKQGTFRIQAEAFDVSDAEHPEDGGPELGVVPLGIPILMGPATMTTLMVFSETRPLLLVLAAFASNVLINVLLVWRAELVSGWLGGAFIRGTGKVMGLILAAIAISMIRVGIQNMIGASGPSL